MRKVFVDANIIVDWLNADSTQNKLCSDCLQIIKSLYSKPMVSPVSIAIVFYLVSKKVKDKSKVKRILTEAFGHFNITSESQQTLNKAFSSHYLDLEDAIQYYSAMEAGADAILTFNGFDYLYSNIPILHPEEFLQLHSLK
ncbi:MAG: PIN domain-containing protein [bacterium]|nr:PIN domain-containing protein [bacterium]